MTVMKRFMTKKVVTKMKLMNSRLSHFLLSGMGAIFSSYCESIAANMMSGQVSSVETSKKVVIDAMISL